MDDAPRSGPAPDEVVPAAARSVAWLSFDRVAAIAVQLVAGIAVVRHLGPERFGLLSWSNAIVWLLVPVVGLGLDDYVRREWATRPAPARHHVLVRVMRVRTGVAVVAVLGLVGVTWWTAPAGAGIGTLVLGAGLLVHPLFTAAIPFEVDLRARTVATARLAVTLAVGAWQVGGVVVGAGLLWFYLGALGALAGHPLAAWLTYRRAYGVAPAPERGPRDGRRPLLLGSVPYAVAAIAGGVTLRIDQLMLESLRGVAEVGVYAAAVRISEVPYFLPIIVAASLIGATARGRGQERAARIARTFDLLTLLGVAVGAATAMAAPLLVRVAFGTAYADAAPVLRLHALALVPFSWTIARWQLLVLEERARVGAVAAVAAAVLNVALNLVLIPPLGPTGAAIATLVATTADALLVAVFVPELRAPAGEMLRSLVRLPMTVRTLAVRSRTPAGNPSRGAPPPTPGA